MTTDSLANNSDKLTYHPRMDSKHNLSSYDKINLPARMVNQPSGPLVLAPPPPTLHPIAYSATEQDAARQSVHAWLAEGAEPRKPCGRCQRGHHCRHCVCCER